MLMKETIAEGTPDETGKFVKGKCGRPPCLSPELREIFEDVREELKFEKANPGKSRIKIK